MHRFGVEAQPDAARLAKLLQLVEQALCDDALAVVADDEGVSLGETRLERGEQTLSGGGVQFAARFSIDAHDLLLAGDNAGLDAGVASRESDESRALNLLFCQQRAQLIRGGVGADDTEELAGRAKGDNRPHLVAAVTDDLVARGLDAGKLVKAAAKVVGGGGGGKPTLAQAGGKDPSRLAEALAQVKPAVESALKPA